MSKKKSKTNTTDRGGYDVEMIRDFLEHIELEVGCFILDHTHAPAEHEVPPELGELITRRRTAALLPMLRSKLPEGIDQATTDALAQRWDEVALRDYCTILVTLESLRPVFDAAFMSANITNQSKGDLPVPVFDIGVQAFIKKGILGVLRGYLDGQPQVDAIEALTDGDNDMERTEAYMEELQN